MNHLNILHLDTDTWDVIEPINDVVPVGRMVFAMYATDSAIFVHGGHGPHGKLNDLWSFDPVANKWSESVQYGDIPPPFYRVGFNSF